MSMVGFAAPRGGYAARGRRNSSELASGSRGRRKLEHVMYDVPSDGRHEAAHLMYEFASGRPYDGGKSNNERDPRTDVAVRGSVRHVTILAFMLWNSASSMTPFSLRSARRASSSAGLLPPPTADWMYALFAASWACAAATACSCIL